ncbi:MAG: restriction endonuclease subunit S [Candidatus Micrarchaeota archaeon]
MTDQLPQVWTTTQISELCNVLKEKGSESVTPYLEISNVSIVSKDYTLTEKPSVKGCRLAKRHDVLVSKVRPTRGAITYVREEDLHVSSAFTVLRNKGAMAEKYLWMFLAWNHKYLNHLGENCTGTMYPTTSDEVVVDFEVPLAPLNEQRRIVAKLDKLLAKVEACQERLNKIPALLKRFRQSVLAAACSGRITADWRDQNKYAVDVNYTQEALSDFPLLPDTWFWQPLATVCEKVVDCPHSTPKWTNSGRLCVRTTNFKPGLLDLTEVRYVSDETFMERILRVKPQPGDVLYSREGGILGIACMIPKEVELCLGQRMMLLRTHPSFSGMLLMHWLNSRTIQYRVQELIGGSASPHLNVKDIKNFPTPVPPIAEQHEIVRRIGALFKIADQIEERYQKAKAHIDKLIQSILAKAFRGELVPQDQNDEPASALIERIRKVPLERRSLKA